MVKNEMRIFFWWYDGWGDDDEIWLMRWMIHEMEMRNDKMEDARMDAWIGWWWWNMMLWYDGAGWCPEPTPRPSHYCNPMSLCTGMPVCVCVCVCVCVRVCIRWCQCVCLRCLCIYSTHLYSMHAHTSMHWRIYVHVAWDVSQNDLSLQRCLCGYSQYQYVATWAHALVEHGCQAENAAKKSAGIARHDGHTQSHIHFSHVRYRVGSFDDFLD